MTTGSVPAVSRVGIEPDTDEYIRARFFAGYDVVARAPACVFLFGNHSVVYGHVGLYLPVPRYTYVGLKEDRSISGLGLAEDNALNWVDATQSLSSCNDRDLDPDPDLDKSKVASYRSLDDQNQDYILRAYDVIRARKFPGRRGLGLRMKVFCQAPTRSGMNTSGSMAAALVMALSAYFEQPLDVDEIARARGPLDAGMLAQPYLRSSAAFEELSTLGWFLDDCLHGLGGTAIGSLGSLLGTDRGLPFIFIGEARTGLSGDALRSADDYFRLAASPRGRRLRARLPWRSRAEHTATAGVERPVVEHPFNYKRLADAPDQRLDLMTKLKRMAVRLDDALPGEPLLPKWWDDSGIGVVYSGNHKYTRDMLGAINSRLQALAETTFVTDILDLALARDMQLNPLESWLRRTNHPPGHIDLREWYRLMGPPPPRDDEFFHLEWRKQQRKELMMILMGGTSYLALNALSAKRSFDFAPLLSQQQALFQALGMSRGPIDFLCRSFDEFRDENGRQPFGATITGGGGGGDVVVFGDREALERHFDATVAKATSEVERLKIEKTESLQVHYRSWTEPRAAEPATIVYRRPSLH